MPPRGRRPGASKPDNSKTLVVGVVGTGDLTTEEVDATMKDLFGTPDINKVETVFALSDDAVGDGLWDAFELVAENASDELTLAAVTYEGGNKEDKALHDEAVDKGAAIVPIQDLASVTVADELVKAQAAGKQAILVVFWVQEEEGSDDDTGGQYAAVETAIQGGVKAFNACDGMDPILLGEDAAEPLAEEEPPRRGRGRPRASDSEAAPAEETKAEEEPPRRRRGRPTNAEKAAAAAAAEEKAAPSASAGDEAQSTMSEEAGMFRLLVKEVAKEIVKLLNEDDSSEAVPPTRRSRRS